MENELKKTKKEIFGENIKYSSTVYCLWRMRGISELFENFILPDEVKIREIAVQLYNKRKDGHKKLHAVLFEGEGLRIMVRYTMLINPYFSASKAAINQLQRVIELKYGIKVKKGYTLRFIKSLRKNKPGSPELKIFDKYIELIKEIKDTRDNTEHYDPKTIIKYKSIDNSITIPIYQKDKNNKYIEKRRVNFLDFMKETNKTIHQILKDIMEI